MDDLISRHAAIDALNDEFTITGKVNAVTVQDYIRRVNNRLHDLPSAQPERKGKWQMISPAGIYECSECSQNVMTSDIDCYKFCHGCGAKMEDTNDN